LFYKRSSNLRCRAIRGCGRDQTLQKIISYLIRNLDQNMPKNALFLKRSCKNRRSVTPAARDPDMFISSLSNKYNKQLIV